MEFEITKSCDSCSKNRFNPSCVPVVNKEISYDDFFGSYMRPNLPCVIKDVTSTWEASSKWLNDHTVNLEYLKRNYGSCDVTIYNCNDRYFNSQRTESCKFASFLDGWGCERSNSQYLKDWHLEEYFQRRQLLPSPGVLRLRLVERIFSRERPRRLSLRLHGSR
jgi:hypothetical protein